MISKVGTNTEITPKGSAANYRARVTALYNTALGNIKALPAPLITPTRRNLDLELHRINQLCDLAEQSGMSSQFRIPSETDLTLVGDARKELLPIGIATHSASSISKEDLTSRASTTKLCLAACKQKYKLAKKVLEIVGSKDTKKLDQEYAKYKSAFKLYALGYSHDAIRQLTGEKISNRIKFGSFPPEISRLSTKLSEEELAVRKVKVQQITQAAIQRFDQQKSKKGTLPKKLILRLKKLDLVLKIYALGLEPQVIAKITKSSAVEWLKQDCLPISKVKEGKPYKIPKKMDPNAAHVLGAYFGMMRKNTEKSHITFSHQDKSEVMRLKELFVKTFGLELPEVYTKDGKYHLSISRVEFLKDFRKFYKLENVEHALIPVEIIKDENMRYAFLSAYFSFESVAITLGSNQVSFTKFTQPKVMQGVLIALHLEDIYFNFSRTSTRTMAFVKNHVELKKFFALLPEVGEKDKREALLEKIKDNETPPLSSYGDYAQVMNIIRHRCISRRVKLAEFGISKKLTPAEQEAAKAKIANWKAGDVPMIARKHQAIQEMIKNLYPGF